MPLRKVLEAWEWGVQGVGSLPEFLHSSRPKQEKELNATGPQHQLLLFLIKSLGGTQSQTRGWLDKNVCLCVCVFLCVSVYMPVHTCACMCFPCFPSLHSLFLIIVMTIDNAPKMQFWEKVFERTKG